ncbi:MAG: hypothetical protein LAO20_07530 [Acidobacteriia bacterium]|nr:hypothetical protein [Terriglobia bacterium]
MKNHLCFKTRIFLNARCWLLAACAFSANIFAGQAFAAQITGTVTNGTTNKPASGTEVVLLSLAGGMEEAGRVRTDGQGHFSFEFNDVSVPHLIRVDYQGASYFRQVPPGTTTADISIYDAAMQVDHLIAEAHIFQLQAGGGQLEVRESYTLRNESKPPRTKAGDRTFEIVLPDGAQLKEGSFLRPGGMPLSSMPVPTKQKGHYAFDNPLRPGQSQFQVTYTLPYGGSQDFVIKPDMLTAEIGIMLPKSMQFKARGEDFLTAQEESGMATFVAKSVPAGRTLQFSVSGEGSAPMEAKQGGARVPTQGGPQAGSGGGLGPPNNSADPLSGLRWYVIGGVAVIIAGGAWFAMRKKNALAQAGMAASEPGSSPATSSRRGTRQDGQRTSSPPAGAASMLDVIKEELFQLETDRLLGKISPQEYQASKAGLESLLRRQLKNS